MQPAPLTGTATFILMRCRYGIDACNPHPSRGQQLYLISSLLIGFIHATRTPHGDKKAVKIALKMRNFTALVFEKGVAEAIFSV